MKLRYTPRSPYVRKVMVVAIEKGLAERITTVPTDVLPTQPNQELARENPLVKLPTLVTDAGDILYDSPVICEYLDSIGVGPRLFPEGAQRWTALRRQALGDGILDAAVLALYESRRPPALYWNQWYDGQLYKIRSALDVLERENLGAAVDIGTIAVGCALGYLDFRYADEDWRRTHPRLADWFAEISARPSLRETAPRG